MQDSSERIFLVVSIPWIKRRRFFLYFSFVFSPSIKGSRSIFFWFQVNDRAPADSRRPHLERNIRHQRVNLYEVDQPTTYCSCDGIGSMAVAVVVVGVVGPKPRSWLCRYQRRSSSKGTTSSLLMLDAEFPIQRLESPAVVARGRCFRHLLIFVFIFGCCFVMLPRWRNICHHQHRRYACLRWFSVFFHKMDDASKINRKKKRTQHNNKRTGMYKASTETTWRRR